MTHKLGITSRERLATCHRDLQAIMELAITRSNVDFSITQGARSFDLQLEYYKGGKSKLDPRIESNLLRAKHVTLEGIRDMAEAVDIAIYGPGNLRQEMLYDINSLCYVAGVVQSCARELYDCGEICHLIRWGGNFDKDAVILKDQSFDDLPHFELYKP